MASGEGNGVNRVSIQIPANGGLPLAAVFSFPAVESHMRFPATQADSRLFSMLWWLSNYNRRVSNLNCFVGCVAVCLLDQGMHSNPARDGMQELGAIERQLPAEGSTSEALPNNMGCCSIECYEIAVPAPVPIASPAEAPLQDLLPAASAEVPSPGQSQASSPAGAAEAPPVLSQPPGGFAAGPADAVYACSCCTSLSTHDMADRCTRALQH